MHRQSQSEIPRFKATCLLFVLGTAIHSMPFVSDVRGQAPAKESMIALEIEAAQPRLMPNEPMALIVRIVNRGSDSVLFRNMLTGGIMESSQLKISIVNPTGAERVVAPLGHFGRGYLPPREFAPGDSIAYMELITHDRNGPFFEEIGEYRILAEYRDESGILRSEGISVTVIPPDDAEASLVFSRIGRQPAPVIDPMRAGFLDEEMAKGFEEVVNRHPQSGYARYAMFALALWSSEVRYTKELRRLDPDYARAIQLLELAQRSAEPKEWPLGEYVRYHIARCRAASGQASVAKPMLEEIVVETKDHRLKIRANQLLAKIGGH